MVGAVEGEVVLWHEFVMKPVQCGAFLVVGADVHYLDGFALVVFLEPDEVEGRWVLFDSECLGGVLDHRFSNPFWLHYHHGPFPAVFIAGYEDFGVVGGPEAFEWHNGIIFAELVFAGEFECVGESE